MSDFDNVSISDSDSFVNIKISNIDDISVVTMPSDLSITDESNCLGLDEIKPYELLSDFVLHKSELDIPEPQSEREFDLPCPISNYESELPEFHLHISDPPESEYSLFTDIGIKILDGCETLIKTSEEYFNDILDEIYDETNDIDINMPPLILCTELEQEPTQEPTQELTKQTQ